MTRQRVVMVYGSFTEPTTGKNFIAVRYPDGRQSWSRKIAPAINRLVGGWFTVSQRAEDRRARQLGLEPVVFWAVESNDDLWTLKQPIARYEWTGAILQPVSQVVGTTTGRVDTSLPGVNNAPRSVS